MIIGITGSLCSGKEFMSRYLVQTYGFEAINVMFIFKTRLRAQRNKQRRLKALLAKEAQQAKEAQEERKDQDDNIEEDDPELDAPSLKMSDSDLGILDNNDHFCKAYFMPEFKDLRQNIIREVFRDLTGKWDRNFVIYPLSPCDNFQLMFSRFYFILYEVEAPLRIRFERWETKYAKMDSDLLTLDSFIELDDRLKFNTEEFSLQMTVSEQGHLVKRKFQNKTNDSLQFMNELSKFNFNNKQLVRPTFDTYFMRLAELAASRANCMKRGNGAIITKDQRVVATGYNGTPFGLTNCNEGGCKRCNDNVHQGIDLDKCLCLHAEESAVMEAGRPRCIGGTIYTTSFPCQLCTKMIIQAGIVRIVYNKNYDSYLSKEMLAMTNIQIVCCNPETGTIKVTQNRDRNSPSQLLEDVISQKTTGNGLDLPSNFTSPMKLKRQKTEV